MPWPAIVFGWPFVALAVAAYVVAYATARPRFALVGAALAAPFCFFVSLYPVPIGRLGGPIALCANVASAWLLQRGRRSAGAACLAPFLVVAGVFAWLVITQPQPYP